MRAHDFINEIQRYKSDSGALSTKGLNYDKQTLSKIKMLPGSDRFGYTAGSGGRITSFSTGAEYIIELFDVKHPEDGLRKVGFLALRPTPWFPVKNSYQVANVGLDDEYRGQGLGQNLYGVAMKLLGMTIIADDSQTPEARRAWLRLSQIPGVSINGYTSIFADDWNYRDYPSEIYDESAKRLISALLRAGGQELGKKPNFVYVSFPVGANADRTELQSIQKGISIYSARHPEEGGTSNGLYARWAGPVREQGMVEAREGVMRNVLRKELPSWPDYVIKDWISSRVKNEEDLKNLIGWIRELNKTVQPNSWKLHQKMFLTFDMLNARSRYFMKIKRAFGDKNPFLIPRDRERLESAMELVKTKGMENLPPVIMLQHANGLELCEGWHRTIAAFR
jgi:hypothetical protein